MEEEKTLLLLRFGELWLKSAEVRRRFMDRLITNIREAFLAKGIPAKITDSRDRIFVEADAKDSRAVSGVLSHTFGLVSFSLASKVSADKNAIFEAILDIAKRNIRPKDTFAIRAQRSGTHEFTSNELERECGAKVVQLLGNKVNLTKPDRTIFIDVRGGDAYVFSEKIPAPGGLPLGVEGKLVVPFAGDFKRNIVASYLMMKRGCRILPAFSKGEKLVKKTVEFLAQFDPLAKPYFSELKLLDKFALELCRKKKAEGIVLTDGVEAFYGKKKIKMFDRKAQIPYLYPLVGYAEEDIAHLYETVS